MPNIIKSAADLPNLGHSSYERKAWKRSAKYLRSCMNLASVRVQRLHAQREANPRTTKEKQLSTFVDPRSQARVAEQVAPLPQAKKRTYKAKPKTKADALILGQI